MAFISPLGFLDIDIDIDGLLIALAGGVGDI